MTAVPTLYGLNPDELMVFQSIYLGEPVKAATCETLRAAMSLADRGLMKVEWGSGSSSVHLYLIFTDDGEAMAKRIWTDMY